MILLQLYKDGSVELLFRRGLLSAEIFIYFKIALYYQEQRNLGYGYNAAIERAAISFDTSTSTVKRAIRKVC